MPSWMMRERRLFVGMAAVFTVALAARLIFLFEFSSVPLFSSPTMDMLYHDQWARDILAGQGALYAPFFRAPFYPYVLAFMYTLFGSGGWGVGIVQSVLGSCSAVLVFLIGRRLSGHVAGIVAGLVMAFWGPLIFYDVQRLAVGLTIFLDLGALWFLVPGGRPKRRSDFALGGLCLGLSAIARPTILLFAAGYAVWLVTRIRKTALGGTVAHAALYLAALGTPILAVAAYNFAESGQPVIIGTYSGLNFYIGNNRGSDGMSAQLPGVEHDWWGLMEGSKRQAEREAGRALSASQQSSFWWRKARSELFGDPQAWLMLVGKKALFLLQGVELSNNIDFYYFAHQSRLLRILILGRPLFFPWGLFILPAIVGLVVGLRHSPGMRLMAWFALSNAIAVVLFFVTARYRLPLVPVVALFAVTGTQFLWQEFRRRPVLWRTGALALMACAYVAANADVFRHAPRTEAPGLFAMAAAYERAQDLDKAEQYYRDAVAADPTFVQAYNDLGLLQISRGDLRLAVETLSAGMVAAPDHPILLYNLAYAYLLDGDAQSAMPLLHAVLAAQPENLDALNNLGTAFNLTNRFDSARVRFEEVLSHEPSFHAARFGLGWALQEEGQLDSARACFRATAKAGVNVAESWYRIGQSWVAEGRADSAIASLRLCLAQLNAEHSGAAGEVELQLDSLNRK